MQPACSSGLPQSVAWVASAAKHGGSCHKPPVCRETVRTVDQFVRMNIMLSQAPVISGIMNSRPAGDADAQTAN
jgi:hypothetical protein